MLQRGIGGAGGVEWKVNDIVIHKPHRVELSGEEEAVAVTAADASHCQKKQNKTASTVGGFTDVASSFPFTGQK